MDKTAEQFFYEGLTEKLAEVLPPPIPEPIVAPPAPSVPKQLTHRSVFSHPEAHPVALDMVLLKHFQLDWLSWLPETVFKEIQETFNTSIAEVNKIKILATQTLHVIDAFWEEWEVFEKTVWALNGMIPRVDAVQPPDLPMLFAGVDIASHIAQHEYSEEVARYCAAIFLHEGVVYAPSPLNFCQQYISQPYYKCKDCDKKASILPPFDGFCSSCAGHYEREHPLKLEADPEAVKRGAGQNLSFDLTFDPNPVKTRFQELNKMPADKLAKAIKETQEDIQSAKLIGAIDFQRYRAKQLSDQLTSLRSWLEAS